MAAEDVLEQYPTLKQFVLPNVRLTGIGIGAGAYGSVEEVAVPGAICAAKKIHEFFLDGEIRIEVTTETFLEECQLMSTLRHPNIVQFLGVAFFPGSRLPAIVMERLLTSLHDLLEPQRPPPRSSKPFIPLSLKCSILHDVACGLAYLHERSVVHRDLTANNVLLNSGMVAKIADLGVARILPDLAPATLTFAPGASVYMPPEALESKPGEENEGRMSKYDASIDIFSFGVVAMFTISQTFPYKLLAPTYTKDGENPVGRSELERRQEYMTIVNSRLEGKHPLLVEIIEKCLDFPGKRPDVKKVLDLLVEARKEVLDEQISKNKLDLVQALREAHISHQENEKQLQSSLKEQEALKEKSEKSLETIREKRQQILEENQLVQNKDRELTETLEKLRQKEEQLQTSEREKQIVQQLLTRKEAELMRKEAEVTRAEETIGREQQQIQEMRQRERQPRTSFAFHFFIPISLALALLYIYLSASTQYQETELVQTKDREIALLQQQLTETREKLRQDEEVLRVIDFIKLNCNVFFAFGVLVCVGFWGFPFRI